MADTLEHRAQGDRMVGVVTHVQRLADRVPHRFLIERNSRTSTLTVQDGPRMTNPAPSVLSLSKDPDDRPHLEPPESHHNILSLSKDCA